MLSDSCLILLADHSLNLTCRLGGANAIPNKQNDVLSKSDAPALTSARQGVQVLGEIIEVAGAGEGFGVAFVDKDGAWYLETVSGHHWVARSVPADAYFVSANQGRIQTMDFSDSEHYLWSKELPEFAAKNGLYNPDREPLNIFKCCMTNSKKDTTYNYPRVRKLITLYSGAEHDNNDGLFSLLTISCRCRM